jgi:hypothetical protein
MPRRWLSRVVAPWLAGMALAATGAPLSQERVMELCAQAESPGHCGRRIEAEQLKMLPNLATRDGDTLKVTLFPAGTREFVDTIVGADSRAYAVWDYWSNVNAVVLFITEGDKIAYGVLQRANGQMTLVPAEPLLAPDRQRIAVADFCTSDCTNELSVWRVARDGIRKEAGFVPAKPWSDVTASWAKDDVLTLRYTMPGEDKPRTQDMPLSSPNWKRIGAAN